ncbi:MAG: hypothetical protein AMXMBFR84_21410 [Candidatus Hydrogenedentota bacterium]
MWNKTEYQRRLKWMFVISCAIHVIMLVATASLRPPVSYSFALSDGVQPMTVKLAPRKQTPKRLIDTYQPAEEAPDSATDLISENDSNARDMSDVEAPREAPHAEKPAEFDELGSPPEPAAPAKPSESPASVPAVVPEPAEAPAPPAVEDILPKPVDDSPLPTPTPASEAAGAVEAERVQLAKLAPETPVKMTPGEIKGRPNGGTNRRGLLSYEAMSNQFAPYLKEVRSNVERRWRGLMINYTGTKATNAVIDCSIGPDGKLAHVEIVDAGDSATYAALCKKAIEDAGPFKPFPFRIPEIYAEETLDIRWTFSYL